ncbi:MAG: hypothetical protein OXI55_12075 [Gammaproteobacteria bacterium]|nr:hypothetical protein [Gammaproteobacteria bacterium]
MSTTEKSKPWVRLHFTTDAGIAGGTAGVDVVPTAAVSDANVTATSQGTVKFSLSEGAQFADTVSSNDLMISTTPAANATASVQEGGNAGDSSVTFLLAFTDAITDNSTFTFVLPRLQNLSALANPSKKVTVSTTTRATAGTGFPTGGVQYYCRTAVVPADGTDTDEAAADACDDSKRYGEGGIAPAKIVAMSADAVALSKPANRLGDASVRIDIDDRGHLVKNTARLSGLPNPHNPNTFYVGEDAAAQLASMMLSVKTEDDGAPILQTSGDIVDYGLAGVLNVTVSTSAMFGEDDRIFVNWNDKGGWWEGRTIDNGESLTVSADMATFDGLSIDSDDRAERPIGVYYIPGGKMDLQHGTVITTTATVNYTPNTAKDEDAREAKVELRFQGVAGAVKAYAIPHSGAIDKANLRVRCEAAAGCRVFLECWDDMGMRNFGEAGMIAGSALMKWNAMEIEDVIGVSEPTSRHSCRVLSVGSVSVQQLTRDGNSGTLVNNTHVEM